MLLPGANGTVRLAAGIRFHCGTRWLGNVAYATYIDPCLSWSWKNTSLSPIRGPSEHNDIVRRVERSQLRLLFEPSSLLDSNRACPRHLNTPFLQSREKFQYCAKTESHADDKRHRPLGPLWFACCARKSSSFSSSSSSDPDFSKGEKSTTGNSNVTLMDSSSTMMMMMMILVVVVVDNTRTTCLCAKQRPRIRPEDSCG